MEYLIKPNGFGLFAEKSSGQAMISSLTVAEVFEKQHAHVLEAIKNLDCSEDFRESNFRFSKYKVEGQKRKTDRQ